MKEFILIISKGSWCSSCSMRLIVDTYAMSGSPSLTRSLSPPNIHIDMETGSKYYHLVSMYQYMNKVKNRSPGPRTEALVFLLLAIHAGNNDVSCRNRIKGIPGCVQWLWLLMQSLTWCTVVNPLYVTKMKIGKYHTKLSLEDVELKSSANGKVRDLYFVDFIVATFWET